MKITSVALPDELAGDLEQIGARHERSRSFIVRRLLEFSLSGEQRLEALRQLSELHLRGPDEPRPPHVGELLASASGDGKATIAAHRKVERA